MLATAIQNCSRKNVVFPFEYFLKLSFPGRFFQFGMWKNSKKQDEFSSWKEFRFFHISFFGKTRKFASFFKNAKKHSSTSWIRQNEFVSCDELIRHNILWKKHIEPSPPFFMKFTAPFATHICIHLTRWTVQKQKNQTFKKFCLFTGNWNTTSFLVFFLFTCAKSHYLTHRIMQKKHFCTNLRKKNPIFRIQTLTFTFKRQKKERSIEKMFMFSPRWRKKSSAKTLNTKNG
jgi:hypothetical protein